MTARYENQIIPSREQEVCVEVICDLCGRSAPNPRDFGSHSGFGEWATGRYEVSMVSLSYEAGHNYPGDRFTEIESFDVCPECWSAKVVPWLVSQGATLTTRESGY